MHYVHAMLPKSRVVVEWADGVQQGREKL